MATGPYHYQEAERLADAASKARREVAWNAAQQYALEAQMHATLALAAATALHPREALTTEFRDQVAAPWVQVAG